MKQCALLNVVKVPTGKDGLNNLMSQIQVSEIHWGKLTCIFHEMFIVTVESSIGSNETT